MHTDLICKRVLGMRMATTLLLAVTVSAAAQEPAKAKRIPSFPGAGGFGAMTPGGRGGRIIEVTNLDAKGPGSLNAACRAKGPRIVVFRVGGIIEGGVGVNQPYITIAGQTAPGDGICLCNGPLVVETHDVIIRHLRSRPGDSPFASRDPGNRDCVDIGGDRTRNVIIDHCSFSWGTDENVATWYGPRDITIQWCISSEALSDSIHPKGSHGCGMILGSRDNTVSVHHCLLAHNETRNALIGDTGKGKGPSFFDFRNNLIYNHGKWSCTNVRGNTRINYVGNFIKMGPNGIKSRPRGLRIRPQGQQWAYVSDNIWPGKPAGEVDDWLVVGGRLGPTAKPFPQTRRLTEPVAVPRAHAEPASQAYENVLRFVGCTRPVRDVVDARIVAEVRAGTGRIIDSQEEVGGWPTYASAAPAADADHDAMPDAWEKRFGFDPKEPADGPKDLDGDGYTNIEEFLNQTDPTKPDTDAPVIQAAVQVQSGNDRIRGEAARKVGEERLARQKRANATEESRTALLRKVRESGKEVADLLGIRFVTIPKGELMVGQVKVTLTKPFDLSACEITQAQWKSVMGTRPWSGRTAAKDDPDCPATYVNYLDCQEFIARVNACGGRKYRLPTYCEWLHAAAAGSDSAYAFGKDKDRAYEYAWCITRLRDKDNRWVWRSPTSPQAVGRLKPNPWGLYDMAGNAHEWCHDWWGWRRYGARKPSPTMTDPMGPKTGESRVLCGRNFRNRARDVLGRPSSVHRPHYRAFGVGFRLRRAVP